MPSNLIETQYLSKNDYPLWDEFVKNSPQGSFFCSIVWLQILAEVNNRSFKILVCKRNNKIVAGLPFFENKKGFWKFITPVFLMPYEGPLFLTNQDSKLQKIIADQLEFLEYLIKWLLKEYSLIQLKTHYSQNDLRAFTWNDFQIEPEHTYVCKLDNELTVYNRFNQSLRKKIQKCNELKYKIIPSVDLDFFTEMYFSSYKRHGNKPPISLDKFKYLLQKIVELSNVQLYFIKRENQVLAGRIIMESGDTIFDLLAGNNDENGLASAFLVAEIMRLYAGKFKYFDFMGADHPEIEKFKRAFGGDLLHQFRVKNKLGIFLSLMLKVKEIIELSRRKI